MFDKLSGEYRRLLEKLNRTHYGTEQGQDGSFVRRLLGYEPLVCWVVGAFLEGINDFHTFPGTLADSQLSFTGLARRKEEADVQKVAYPGI